MNLGQRIPLALVQVGMKRQLQQIDAFLFQAHLFQFAQLGGVAQPFIDSGLGIRFEVRVRQAFFQIFGPECLGEWRLSQRFRRCLCIGRRVVFRLRT